MQTNDPVVSIQNLWMFYGKTPAVRDLSLDIPRGEIFGFIGPNGAGKTSTIKVLATLLKPTRGRAFVCGIDVTAQPGLIRRKIGYMPDFFGVYRTLTAEEYLHFFAAAYRIDSAKRKAVVSDVLALTDLTAKQHAPVDSLSRGMKQRLGLARVLLHELSQFCTRIGIIEGGQMMAEGSLTDIYRALSLKRTIHVQLANTTPALLEKIRAIPAVTSVEENADRIAVQLREDEMPIEDLLSAIHGLGGRIRMFQADAMDMETAFMKLTEGKTA